MSLEDARHVHSEHPELLQQNLGETCHQFTAYLIARLRAKGHEAFHICKTSGEGQYVPHGFQPRDVEGLDGKRYLCTGVSHDAIWIDGIQVDTIAGANDSDQPISAKASPVWNVIPSQYWRANNPPLKMAPVISPPNPPAPPPPPQRQRKPYPGDHPFDAVGVSLFADYARAGNPPDPQMGRWFGRTIYDWLEDVEPTLDASITKHRAEWRTLLGLPPLP